MTPLTLFTATKPFEGHVGVIQRNAIRSWQAVFPEAQVLVYGVHPSIAENCGLLGVQHVSDVEVTELGTQLLSSVFDSAQRLAQSSLMCYLNCDILLTPQFGEMVRRLSVGPSDDVLVCGRRTDLDVRDELSFYDERAWDDLARRVAAGGALHGYSGLDYFIFPRGMLPDFPGFVVGRAGWDNWLVRHVLERGIPFVDATVAAPIVHQNHPPSYTTTHVESVANVTLAGGLGALRTLRDATHRMGSKGIERVAWHRRLAVGAMGTRPLRALLIGWRRLQRWRGAA